MTIPVKQMFVGETAEVITFAGESSDLKRLRSMGLREGTLVDLLHYDPIAAKKLVIGVGSSRIAFDADLAGGIMVRPLKSCYEILKTQANYDNLTGCLNRHAAESIIKSEEEKFIEKKIPFALLLADIDYFKRINDKYGHPTGDLVLKSCAEVFRKTLRRSDVLCRWGGEEFLILLRGTIMDEANRVAERLRQTIESFALPSLPGEMITVSIGGCGVPPGRPLDCLFEKADSALYSAKNRGRNRVTLC